MRRRGEVFGKQSEGEEPKQEEDEQRAIMATANDAIIAKLSASSKGYYKDPFLPHLVKDASGHSLADSTVFSSQQVRRHRHEHPLPFHRQPQQQQPIIRRGTHARVCVMDRAISSFLTLVSQQSSPSDYNSNLSKEKVDVEAQIVLLGSGRDTTYLRAQYDLLLTPPASESSCSRARPRVAWYEVDHPSMIQTKSRLLSICPLLDITLTQRKDGDGAGTGKKVEGLDGNDNDDEEDDFIFFVLPNSVPTVLNDKRDNDMEPYYLIGHDLRTHHQQLMDRLCRKCSFRPHLPTLFLLECVQMYLPDCDSRNLLTTISKTCQQPFVALYDPILQNDPFGKVMERNLTKAGIITTTNNIINTNTSSTTHPQTNHLPSDNKSDRDPYRQQSSSNPNTISLVICRTLEQQLSKLVQCGFDTVTGCDMMTAYDTVIDASNRMKANRCEMLDELEEWMLIMRHYCFVVAGKRTMKGDGGDDDCSDVHSRNGPCLANLFCSVGIESLLGFVKGRCLTTLSSN